MSDKVAVIGAGAWGTAFAAHLVRCGHDVSIWCREPETAADIRSGKNETFLPKIELPEKIEPTTDLRIAIDGARFVFFAVPVQHIASVVGKIPADSIREDAIFVSLSKGIERSSGRLPSAIIEKAIAGKRTVIALSGPSFAAEVAKGKPTILVAAGEAFAARAVQHAVASENLRAYYSDDRLGVELSAALKNVLALAAGLSDGIGLGENARAALIVRGLAEMHRLLKALGASGTTAFGIAGLGDLVLTCTSDASRNYTLGKMIAKGQRASDVLSKVNWVAEGAYTAGAALELASNAGVELPITEQIVAVLDEKISPTDAAYRLMTRPLKAEFPK